jgi:hypothetical protein
LTAVFLIAVLPFRLVGYCMYAMSAFTVISWIHIVVTLASASVRKEDGALINLVGYSLSILGLVHDALVAANVIWTQVYFSSITMNIFLFMQSWVLSRRFEGAIRLIETMTDKLELSNTHLLTSLSGMEDELARKTYLLKESERKFRGREIL